MAKVAKLVLISLMTRVVVEDTATDEEIVEAARPQLVDKMRTDLHENIEEIIDDEEVPYGKGLNEK
jgi:uncharacterized protein YbcI